MTFATILRFPAVSCNAADHLHLEVAVIRSRIDPRRGYHLSLRARRCTTSRTPLPNLSVVLDLALLLTGTTQGAIFQLVFEATYRSIPLPPLTRLSSSSF